MKALLPPASGGIHAQPRRPTCPRPLGSRTPSCCPRRSSTVSHATCNAESAGRDSRATHALRSASKAKNVELPGRDREVDPSWLVGPALWGGARPGRGPRNCRRPSPSRAPYARTTPPISPSKQDRPPAPPPPINNSKQAETNSRRLLAPLNRHDRLPILTDLRMKQSRLRLESVLRLEPKLQTVRRQIQR